MTEVTSPEHAPSRGRSQRSTSSGSLCTASLHMALCQTRLRSRAGTIAMGHGRRPPARGAGTELNRESGGLGAVSASGASKRSAAARCGYRQTYVCWKPHNCCSRDGRRSRRDPQVPISDGITQSGKKSLAGLCGYLKIPTRLLEPSKPGHNVPLGLHVRHCDLDLFQHVCP